ncbi:MAG: pyruvate kinase [Thermodesulfobacteriota bacterium]|jgi:pyruvate kinase|nr:MAG: pyruvate kinase [Thermodesulfobacteriota bacterium]
MALPTHKTKIVCTIGPASDSREVLEEMINSGMNVARLNFSHGDFTSHEKTVRNLRAASQTMGKPLAIMADLPGPKMRIGQFAQEPIELRIGDSFTLTTDNIVGNKDRVSVTFSLLPQAVKPGDRLYLNDGLIQLEVSGVSGTDVQCRILVGGELRSRKGLNLPGIDLGIRAFTEQDHRWLVFAKEQGLDAVSQSFVEGAADIAAVRKAAADLNYHPFIIAKIERSRALDHIDEIFEITDGIMIARGDLGVEIPIEQIAVVQKRLMHLANVRAKPVITATQMLESMIDNRRPTRAEATDVANAILDGTDAVMLSGESAMGRYPVDAVAMLAKIATVVEPHRPANTVKELFRETDLKDKLRPSHLVVLGVEASLEYASPTAVFVPTGSGATARRIAGFHLPVWVIAVCTEETTYQQLQFSSGVYPVHERKEPANWNTYVKQWVYDYHLEGDCVILTAGPSPKHPEANNRMEIIDLRPKAKIG